MPHPPKPAAFLVLIALAGTAQALPPLGLTPLGPATIDYQHVTLLNGNAYIGRPSGLTVVDGTGRVADVDLSLPGHGPPVSVTRVVNGPDGAIYTAANFDFPAERPALFELSQPADPVVTWERGDDVKGLLPSLVAIGNVDGRASALLPDGTNEFYVTPDRYESIDIRRVSASGFAIGTGSIPNTLGVDNLLYSQDRTVYRRLDSPLSINERSESGDIVLIFNGFVTVDVPPNPAEPFMNPIDRNRPEVLPIDYILTGTDLIFATGLEDKHGVSTDPILTGPPGGSGPPLILRPIVEVFPDLPPLNDSRLIDVDTIDGRFYLLFENDGQAFLYGGVDPTVIPEPGAFTLAAMLVAGLFACATPAYRRKLAKH